MKKLLFFILIIIPTAFGITNDVEIQKYVDTWNKIAPTQVTTDIYLVEKFQKEHGISKEGIAACFRYNKRFIVILKSYWDTIDAGMKEILIFHELAHCELNLEHRNQKYYKISLSLLNWQLFQSNFYLKNRTAYWKELFLNDDKPLKEAILKEYCLKYKHDKVCQ